MYIYIYTHICQAPGGLAPGLPLPVRGLRLPAGRVPIFI